MKRAFEASSVCDTLAFANFVQDNMTSRLANFLFGTGLFIVKFQPEIKVLLDICNMSEYKFFTACTKAEDNADFMKHFNAGIFDHIVYGTDTEDADSVGGFSQREINLIVEEINALRS